MLYIDMLQSVNHKIILKDGEVLLYALGKGFKPFDKMRMGSPNMIHEIASVMKQLGYEIYFKFNLKLKYNCVTMHVMKTEEVQENV